MTYNQRLLKIVVHMTLYGVLLGAVVGVLVGMYMMLIRGSATSADGLGRILSGILFSLVGGPQFGGIYGGVSGFLSGVLMAGVTGIAFRRIHDPRLFKGVMGMMTAIITGIVLFDSMSAYADGIEVTWASALVMSVMIAVYVSQIVARDYLHETSLRKRKVEM